MRNLVALAYTAIECIANRQAVFFLYAEGRFRNEIWMSQFMINDGRFKQTMKRLRVLHVTIQMLLFILISDYY